MSKIEVNTVAPQCGTTLTLGESGDTVTLGSGANQSGFGRTGTVDWQTTPKTGDFTGANGEGYFINTAGGAITMTLPSASAGHIISIQDYNNTFDSNEFIIQAGSGVKINGGAAAGTLKLETEGQGLTLIYVDSTVGWRSIESTTFSSQSSVATYITATGGSILTSGDFKIHTFTGPGTFTVCSVGNPAGSDTVDYLVVAGGGATPGLAYSNTPSGGGGAGGLRASATTYAIGCNPAKPLVCGVSALPVSAQGYPIVVGGGGSGGSAGPGNAGTNGVNSSFSTITSTGGGAGGHGCLGPSSDDAGKPGGSGGGGGKSYVAGTGNAPPVTPPQGNPGGVGSGHPTNPAPYTVDNVGLGGGGGARASGSCGGNNPNNPPNAGGDGGDGAGFTDGAFNSANGECVSCVQYFAGGGAGGVYTPNPAPGPGGIGGLGGGGNGGSPANPSCVTSPARLGQAGTANTGGGGGSSGGAPSPTSNFVGQGGGSGIVVIRYKFQN